MNLLALLVAHAPSSYALLVLVLLLLYNGSSRDEDDKDDEDDADDALKHAHGDCRSSSK